MSRYQRCLLDASPLVAIFQPNEDHHRACVETLRHIVPPLLTTWPVITEAHYLLRADPHAQSQLFTILQSDTIRTQGLGDRFLAWCQDFADRYADHDVQLADASLVWAAETLDLDTVFTLDRRDFSVFRTTDGRALTIIP